MNFDVLIVLLAITFVSGVILTMHFQSKRPINVNVNAHAEAHGGAAHVNTPASSPAPRQTGGSLLSYIKLGVIALLVLFCVVMAGNILSKIGQPAQVVVNVPKQEPQPAPNIVVPKAEPPTINVAPQTPVVNVPVASSPLETILLIMGGIASLAVTTASILILRAIRAKDQPVAQMQNPVEYVKTDYGWTTKPVEKKVEPAPINAESVAPGLFTRREQ